MKKINIVIISTVLANCLLAGNLIMDKEDNSKGQSVLYSYFTNGKDINGFTYFHHCTTDSDEIGCF